MYNREEYWVVYKRLDEVKFYISNANSLGNKESIWGPDDLRSYTGRSYKECMDIKEWYIRNTNVGGLEYKIITDEERRKGGITM